ncbi:MAG: hypothetical protein SFW67_25180 [Myxococcaceae bacterium]|nr:hypothetical protein [Myxococcaceae bacterium]
MRPFVLAVGAAGLGACAFDLARVRADLSPRASQEFSCPADKLTFQEVKVPLAASNVLVSGCGKSEEFTLEEGRWRPARRVSR